MIQNLPWNPHLVSVHNRQSCDSHLNIQPVIAGVSHSFLQLFDGSKHQIQLKTLYPIIVSRRSIFPLLKSKISTRTSHENGLQTTILRIILNINLHFNKVVHTVESNEHSLISNKNCRRRGVTSIPSLVKVRIVECLQEIFNMKINDLAYGDLGGIFLWQRESRGTFL